MMLAVVMVQKQYDQKFIPGTKKWYDGTSVHFGNGIGERLEGPVIFFLFGLSLGERLHYLDPFCVVTAPNISDRGGGSGEGKAGMVWRGECGRCSDGTTV
jgi:hypothetical protein